MSTASRPASNSRRSFFGLGKDKSSEGRDDKPKSGFKMGRTTSRLSAHASSSGETSENYASSFGSSHALGARVGGAGQPSREEWDAQQQQQQHRRSQAEPSTSPAAGVHSDSSGAMPPPQQARRMSAVGATDLPAGGPLSQQSLRAQNEIRTAVDLITMQPGKVYLTSPPTLKSMVAAGPDGNHPK